MVLMRAEGELLPLLDRPPSFEYLLQRIQANTLSAGEAHKLVNELTTSFVSSKSNPLS